MSLDYRLAAGRGEAGPAAARAAACGTAGPRREREESREEEPARERPRREDSRRSEGRRDTPRGEGQPAKVRRREEKNDHRENEKKAAVERGTRGRAAAGGGRRWVLFDLGHHVPSATLTVAFFSFSRRTFFASGGRAFAALPLSAGRLAATFRPARILASRSFASRFFFTRFFTLASGSCGHRAMSAAAGPAFLFRRQWRCASSSARLDQSAFGGGSGAARFWRRLRRTRGGARSCLSGGCLFFPVVALPRRSPRRTCARSSQLDFDSALSMLLLQLIRIIVKPAGISPAGLAISRKAPTV